jgi:hypothetical protein
LSRLFAGALSCHVEVGFAASPDRTWASRTGHLAKRSIDSDR